MSDRIYADHAATTFLSPAALEAMLPYLGAKFGNPSSLHSFGEEASHAVAESRRKIAEILRCEPDGIIFTSGGSEADNQAMLIMHRFSEITGRRRLLVSGVEHHAVLNSAAALRERGTDVTELPAGCDGTVSAGAVYSAAESASDTLCGGSFMLINNETGGIFDIRGISEAIHAHGGLIHTDAVQAVGHIPISFAELGVDMLSLSAHKFHGPKGVGALIIGEAVSPFPLIRGGSQENGLRAGTENVAGIVGMAAALSEFAENAERRAAHVLHLQNILSDGLRALGGHINGGGISGIVSVRFDGGDGEALVRSLDLFGIAASAGAACNSKEVGVSHVLTSMGLTEAEAAATVRFSLDHSNTKTEIRRIISVVAELIR